MLDSLTIDELQELFSDFQIEHHVKTGGQKAVYKGCYNDRDIGFKILPLQSKSAAARAEREIEAMERIEAPKLVDLIDYFVTELKGQNTLVIIEEWVEGDNLRREIDTGNFSSELGLKVTRTILETLESFDNENIVHRDIKPANIMISPTEGVKLLDVGIARFLTKDSLTPSFAEMGPGTPNYAAPEQLENEKDLQDTRTDLFSTGIVLFETVTGEHPFDVPGMEIPNAILADRKKDLQGYIRNEELEENLNDIYDRLTQHEPYQRYRKPQFATEDLPEVK